MKKTLRKAKSEKKEVEHKLPELVPGAVNVPFTPDELYNYSHLLSIMAQALEQMAQDAGKVSDAQAFDILSARSQLSAVLATKLSAHYNMGESSSRDVH